MPPDSQNEIENTSLKAKFSKKRIFSYFSLFILIAGLVTSVYLVQNQKIFKSKAAELFGDREVQPQLIRETNLASVATEDHPELFYADLEYNQSTGEVYELKDGKTNGDPPFFLPAPPEKSSEGDFVYRVDLVLNNQLIQSGWSIAYQEISQTRNGTIRFLVTTYYKPGSIIFISQPDKIIWTRSIE